MNALSGDCTGRLWKRCPRLGGVKKDPGLAECQTGKKENSPKKETS